MRLEHGCSSEGSGSFRSWLKPGWRYADISTTELYTHVAQPQLKKSYLAHHPRARARSHQGQLNLLPVATSLTPGPIICAHCMNPACEASKWYCAEHLRLNREAVKRSRQRPLSPAGWPDT